MAEAGGVSPVVVVSASGRWCLCVSGLHDAADHAEGQGPRQVLGLLHQDPRHDVSTELRSGGGGGGVDVVVTADLPLCFQPPAEVRLPLHALLPLLPGLRGQKGDSGGAEGQDGLDLLQKSHHRADAVRRPSGPAGAAELSDSGPFRLPVTGARSLTRASRTTTGTRTPAASVGRSSLTEGSLAFGAATSFSLVCLRLTGHIGIAVPDVHAACELFKEQGVTFVKKPDDGETRALPPRPPDPAPFSPPCVSPQVK